MAGCFGTSIEDRFRERQLDDYLDSLRDDDREDEDTIGDRKYHAMVDDKLTEGSETDGQEVFNADDQVEVSTDISYAKASA